MKKLVFILIFLCWSYSWADEIRVYYDDGSVGVIDVGPGYIDAVVDIASGEWGERFEYSNTIELTDSYGNELYPTPEYMAPFGD